MVTRRSLAALGIVIGVWACGSGGGASAPGGAAVSPTSGAIASMPPYPTASPQPAAAPAPTPPRKSLKEICAKANEVKTSSADAAGARWFAVEKEARDVGAPAKAKDVSMADLQALEKRQAWEELLGRAEDVPPAQRGAAWDKLVERAATGYLQNLAADPSAYSGVFTSQALLTRYPHLSKSPEFLAKRAEAGKTASERCLREAYAGQHCIDMMTGFLKTAGTSADVGFAFGKITRRNQFPYVAVPFFKWAIDKKRAAKEDTSAMCQDEDVRTAMNAGLGLPPDYDNAAGARDITGGACWEAFHEDITTQLTGGTEGYYRDNACAVLKAKGVL